MGLELRSTGHCNFLIPDVDSEKDIKRIGEQMQYKTLKKTEQ